MQEKQIRIAPNEWIVDTRPKPQPKPLAKPALPPKPPSIARSAGQKKGAMKMSEEIWTENFDYVAVEDGRYGDSMLPDPGLQNSIIFSKDPVEMEVDDVDALDLEIVEKELALLIKKKA